MKALEFSNLHTRRNQVSHAEKRTNSWIKSHQEYKKWNEAQAGILWIQGKPGSGKSVLAKTVLKLSKQSADKSIVADWFYSIRAGQTGMSHVSMFRSVLYEVLKQDPSIFESCKTVYRNARRYPPDDWQWTLEDLQQMFTRVVAGPKSMMQSQIIMVLDGIDESRKSENSYNVRTKMLDTLKRSVLLGNSRLKILALSRPSKDVERHFGGFQHIVMQDENQTDIDNLIDSRLVDLERRMRGEDVELRPLEGACEPIEDQQDEIGLPEDTLSTSRSTRSSRALGKGLREIRELLRQQAEGVILWVLLVMYKVIKKATGLFRIDDLLEELRRLPTELEDLYTSIVADLEQEHPKSVLQQSRQILEWVIGASVVRPLTLEELIGGLATPLESALDSQMKALEDPVREYFVVDWNVFRQNIYDICGPFVEIQPRKLTSTTLGPDTWSQDASFDDLVVLVHQTARDFLHRSSGAGQLCVDPSAAEAMVSSAVHRYVDLTFPTQKTAWASSPLCRGLQYKDNAKAAVDYLRDRHLMTFVKDVLPANDFEGLGSRIIPHLYTAVKIRATLYEASQQCYRNRFEFYCHLFGRDIRAARAGWWQILAEIRSDRSTTLTWLVGLAIKERQRMSQLFWLYLRVRILAVWRGPMRYSFLARHLGPNGAGVSALQECLLTPFSFGVSLKVPLPQCAWVSCPPGLLLDSLLAYTLCLIDMVRHF